MGDKSDRSDRSDTSDASELAITNQKGGVGKTTVAINVAGALNARGHEVLFVDMDPQGNATEHLGLLDEYDADPPTLFDVLTDSSERESIHDLVREHEEMDVIPSNIDMTLAVRELQLGNRPTQQLRLALDELGTDQYDYVIIDCPPDMYRLTDNALVAAQNILVPALAETTSKRAFELLLDHIEFLEGDFDISIKERGVVVNRIDVRKKQANEMVKWIQDAFVDVPVTRIRERAAIQNALDDNVSIFKSDPECDMIVRFEEVADSLDQQFSKQSKVVEA